MKFMIKVLTAIVAAVLGLFLFRSVVDVTAISEDLGNLGGFLQIMGTLYGIMAAFIVFVVWTRYDKIKEVSDRETDSLSELFALVTYLEDDEVTEKIKRAISAYARMVIDRGWRKLSMGEKSNKAGEALNHVYVEIRSIKSERKRFPVIFGRIVEKYEDVSDLRTQRVTLCGEHLPVSLRSLLIFDSLALVLSIYLLPISNDFLALFATIVTSGTVALTLNVVFDLDNPLVLGEWNLTPEPFENLIRELDERD